MSFVRPHHNYPLWDFQSRFLKVNSTTHKYRECKHINLGSNPLCVEAVENKAYRNLGQQFTINRYARETSQ